MKKILRRIKFDIRRKPIEQVFKCVVFFIIFSIMFSSFYIIKSAKILERNIIKEYDLYAEIAYNFIYEDTKDGAFKKFSDYNNFIKDIAYHTNYEYYDFNISSGYKRLIRVLKLDDGNSIFYNYDLSNNCDSYYSDINGVVDDLLNNQYFFDTNAPRSTVNIVPKEFQLGYAKITSGRYFKQSELDKNDKVCIIPEGLVSFNEDNKQRLDVGDSIFISELIIDNRNVLLNKSHEFKVIGKYQSVDGRGFKVNNYITEHPIYISENNFLTLYNDAQTAYDNHDLTYLENQSFIIPTNAIFKFNSVNDFNYFVNYFDITNKKNDQPYVLNSTVNNIYLSIQNVLYTSNIISYIAYLMVFVGIVVMIMMMLFEIDSHKKDIGILLAFGESKCNIIIQYLIEISLVFLVSTLLSFIVVSYVSDTFILQIFELNNLTSNLVNTNIFNIVLMVIMIILLMLMIAGVVLMMLINRINPKELLKDE